MALERFRGGDNLAGYRLAFGTYSGFAQAVTLVNSSGTELTGTTATQVQGNIAHDAVDSGNPVKIGGKASQSAPTAVADADRVDLWLGRSGQQITAICSQTGSSFVDVGTVGDGAAMNPGLAVQAYGLTWNGATWDRVRKPSSTHRLLSAAATTNATNVKASAGDVHKIRGFNNKASAVFLKLYNKATAPTVGTDTPVLTFRLAATSDFTIELDGQYFSAGIGYAITGAAADADTTALVAGDIVAMNITYA